MKKTVGASGDNGVHSLFNCAQTKPPFFYIIPLTILPALLCCSLFDSTSRTSSSHLLRSAIHLLPLHTASMNRPSFILGKHAEHAARALSSELSEPKNGDADEVLIYRSAETVKGCNLFDGEWTRDEGYAPAYNPEQCPFIDQAFRCKENGRTDNQYLKWRWQPHGCNLRRFDARAMLERLRGQRMVFVGDSLGRNQWESMLCILSDAIANKSKIYEVHGNPITKHKGFLSIRFEDYNCTVEYYRAPFLVRRVAAPQRSPERVKSLLLLDTMHSSSPRWESAHVLVFNAGHWWTQERTLKSGWYFEEGGQLKEDLEVENAFSRAMRTWKEWINTKVDTNNTSIFFTSYSSPHYRDGTWNMGGKCHHYTQPNFNYSEISVQDLSWTNKIISNVIAQNSQKHITFLDITHLTSYRQDGHPSLWYGENKMGLDFFPVEDCSHWCLPGVPDVWNDILYTFLSKDTDQRQPHVY